MNSEGLKHNVIIKRDDLLLHSSPVRHHLIPKTLKANIGNYFTSAPERQKLGLSTHACIMLLCMVSLRDLYLTYTTNQILMADNAVLPGATAVCVSLSRLSALRTVVLMWWVAVWYWSRMKICGGLLSPLHSSASWEIKLCGQGVKVQRAERESQSGVNAALDGCLVLHNGITNISSRSITVLSTCFKPIVSAVYLKI